MSKITSSTLKWLLLSGLLVIAISLILFLQSTNPYIDRLSDYQQRIARVLEAEVESVSPSIVPYPERRDLVISLPSISMDWSDFFRISQCDLQQWVAHRNSQLGKVMEPATQLAYEIQLMEQIARCLNHAEAPVGGEWKTLFEKKQQQWPFVKWNLTWADEYWQKLFSTSGYQQSFETDEILHLLQALRSIRLQIEQANAFHLASSLAASSSFQNDLWYQAFQDLESHQGVLMRLVYELLVMEGVLNQSTELLQQHLDSGDLCPKPGKNRKLEILSNVLNKKYLQRIQPRQAKMTELMRQLEVELAAWLPDQKHWGDTRLNDEFLQWYALYWKTHEQNGLRERVVESIRQHVTVWTKIASQCEFRMI
ncbi:DUF3080 family protein [Pleionea sp. CnH1-48]|uniref:DUF3080 family protein n=1 Tax=Pleionea sp. CnH1-48 TaxID=2954494 RepID=UPI002097EB0D|nr:DUF3080 family protein [Pleionea sp. CnH1-48]MCO7224566.1 DUF3080 domain-containing protein [Pleionea sp. CnH1-48]